jgi:hypothetical protein
MLLLMGCAFGGRGLRGWSVAAQKGAVLSIELALERCGLVVAERDRRGFVVC